MLLSDNENSEWKFNSMSEPLYLYLSRSAFLVTFTNPYKQLLNAKEISISFIYIIIYLMRKKYIDSLLF